LRFEQIPLGARILRVADAYASLTDARPYRKAYSEKQAREHLLEWTGLEFDPRVTRALLALEPFKELQGYAKEVEPAPDLNLIADEIMSRMQDLGTGL
jgi:HD-GYP domain-containing protein (c-di-GMP phosphodiesterase class II)